VKARERAERKGRLAEALALFRLRLKGYRLLARRFKCPVGEVDLIMRDSLCRGEGQAHR
jgi:putative endonuclease